jgi:hypothetical protein
VLRPPTHDPPSVALTHPSVLCTAEPFSPRSRSCPSLSPPRWTRHPMTYSVPPHSLTHTLLTSTSRTQSFAVRLSAWVFPLPAKARLWPHSHPSLDLRLGIGEGTAQMPGLRLWLFVCPILVYHPLSQFVDHCSVPSKLFTPLSPSPSGPNMLLPRSPSMSPPPHALTTSLSTRPRHRHKEI